MKNAVDWGECLTAVNLVLRPTLGEILLRQLGIVADANGDQLTWLLLSNLAVDAERNARWSAALARYAIAQRPENAAGRSAGSPGRTRRQPGSPICCPSSLS